MRARGGSRVRGRLVSLLGGLGRRGGLRILGGRGRRGGMRGGLGD